MATKVRRVEYFHASIRDQPGESCQVLRQLLELGVNQLAFAAVPIGATRAQLTIFPEDPAALTSLAGKSGLELDGPYEALLVQGDDELGVLVSLHDKLAAAGVNVFASTGVTDGIGKFGYLIYVKQDDFATAAEALGL